MGKVEKSRRNSSLNSLTSMSVSPKALKDFVSFLLSFSNGEIWKEGGDILQCLLGGNTVNCRRYKRGKANYRKLRGKANYR